MNVVDKFDKPFSGDHYDSEPKEHRKRALKTSKDEKLKRGKTRR